jgi:hypothetical protein
LRGDKIVIEDFRQYSSPTPPWFFLKSKDSFVNNAEENLTDALFLGKNQHFINACNFFDEFCVHDHDARAVETVRDYNIILSIAMFMLIEAVSFFLLIVHDLFIEGSGEGHVGELDGSKTLILKGLCVMAHQLFGQDVPFEA